MAAFETVISALSLIRDIYQFFSGHNNMVVLRKKDKFLRYNPSFQVRFYAGEKTIALHTPYTEIADLTKKDYTLSIKVKPGRFKLEHDEQNTAWRDLSEEGSVALKRANRVTQNEDTIRLSNVVIKRNDEIILHVQKAAYADQVRSNLVLDYPFGSEPGKTLPKKHITLRNLLALDYDNRLPPLNEKRLANTVGIACIIFYRHNNLWTPYFVRRTSKLAVFPKGVHCTASGVAVWPANGHTDFDSFFTAHMLEELEEEVGLQKKDLVHFKPLAICREFTRGGKPQVFFAGVTLLSRKELTKKRRLARKVIENTKGWQEVEKDRWFKSSDVVFKSDEVQQKLYSAKVTTETIAAFHYGAIYMNNLFDKRG